METSGSLQCFQLKQKVYLIVLDWDKDMWELQKEKQEQ